VTVEVADGEDGEGNTEYTKKWTGEYERKYTPPGGSTCLTSKTWDLLGKVPKEV